MEHEKEQSEEVEVQGDPAPEKTWEEERAEFAQGIAKLEARLHQERVSTAFYRKAIAAGVSDPDKLAGIVNLSAVTFDDAGNAQGIDEILAAVTEIASRQQPRAIGGPSGGGAVPDMTRTQMLHSAAEKARRTGRPEDVAAYAALKHKQN